MKTRILYMMFLGSLLSFMAGCKHTEKVTIDRKLKPISVRRAVRMVNENEIKFNTLSVKKLGLTINIGGNTNSIHGWYKIKRDSVIQISVQNLFIPVGKMEIRNDSFRVVNHIGKVNLTESIQNICDFIGYDIDFPMIQAILSDRLQPLRPDQAENQFRDYVISIEENMYKISSIRDRRFKKLTFSDQKAERFKNRKDEQHLVKLDIFIDPDLFVVRKIVLHDLDSSSIYTIEFSDFKDLVSKWFPGNIHIFANGPKVLDLKVELSKVSINDENDFNFSVPSKYRRGALKLEK